LGGGGFFDKLVQNEKKRKNRQINKQGQATEESKVYKKKPRQEMTNRRFDSLSNN